MSYLEQKYILLTSHKLKNFKKKQSNLYNFSCPYCGDSEKNKNKTRGYLIERKGNFFFYCHNCSKPQSFKKFLKFINPNIYNEFLIDQLKDSGKYTETEEAAITTSRKYDESLFSSLDRISDLPDTHFAKIFVTNRKIPKKHLASLYYTHKYKAFVNSIIPNKLKGPDGPRLIIPFFYDNKSLIGFTGRALDSDSLRYITIVVDDTLPKIFGLDKVNFNKKYYVLEGPLDSLFIDNSIAVSSADLVGGIRAIGRSNDNAVLIFDNEPRNLEIVKKIGAAVKNNYSVVIWPFDLIQKDINDMILDGLTESQLLHIIDTHTFKGPAAELEFSNWKRIELV